MKHKPVLLGYSKNGRRVTFSPVGSHAAAHFADNPILRPLVETVVPGLILEGEWLELETDLGRPIGLTDEVETTPEDEIVYAKRMGRDTYTPFTKSRPPQPSTLVATSLRHQADGSYELVSAWIGEAASPPFPDEPNATPQSAAYWSGHALVWGSQAVQPGTETTIRPW